MAALQFQNGLLTTIAYLMGERTVNATTSPSRADFLQKTLNELYESYPWKFARTTATLSISGGIATLPTTFDNSHIARVRYLNSSGTQNVLNEIDPDDQDKVVDGDLAYWITSQGDGTFLLRSKDSAPTSLSVSFQTVAPTLDANNTVGTPYPSPMTLALGARRFVKLGQNPDADISQDQAIFEKYRAQDIAAEQTAHPSKRRSSRQSLTGTRTGDF